MLHNDVYPVIVSLHGVNWKMLAHNEDVLEVSFYRFQLDLPQFKYTFELVYIRYYSCELLPIPSVYIYIYIYIYKSFR